MTNKTTSQDNANTQHTAGPWGVDRCLRKKTCRVFRRNTARQGPTIDLDANDGQPVAICAGPDFEKNARLIAAAPDLLEALDNIMSAAALKGVKFSDYLTEQADAAIAKAKVSS